MDNVTRNLIYVTAKRGLLAAALAYAETPSEGQAYALRVQARAFAIARKEAKIDTPILEEP